MSLDDFRFYWISGEQTKLERAMAEDEETWRHVLEGMNQVDTFILGRKICPDHEQYWLAVLANPDGVLPRPANSDVSAADSVPNATNRRATAAAPIAHRITKVTKKRRSQRLR